MMEFATHAFGDALFGAPLEDLAPPVVTPLTEVYVDGVACYLLTREPDWGTVKASFEVLSEQDLGLSQRETRRAFASKMRASMSFQTVLNPSDSAIFRAAIGVMDNRPVLCPFWPAMASLSGASGASIQGALRVWFERDWSDWEIGTGASPTGFTPSSQALTAPLLWGRFDKLPDRIAENPRVDETVRFEVLETGPAAYALTARTITLTLGDDVGGEDTPVLTTQLHWSKPKATVEIRVDRERIGYGREEVEDYAAQTPRTRQTLTMRASSSDHVALLLRLFEERSGSVRPWWSPASHSWEAADRFLARFRSSKLTVTWDVPAMDGTRESAEASLDIVSVPTEDDVPPGEIIGETLGELPGLCWLYTVTDGVTTWRRTSYESEIDAGALGTFVPCGIDHDDDERELNLVKHEMALTVAYFDGSPFERLRTDRYYSDGVKLKVTIRQAEVGDEEASASVIFTGTVRAPKFKGSVCNCTLGGLTSLFDIRGPLAVAMRRCWFPFGGTLCGYDIDANAVAADLQSIDVDGKLVFEQTAGGGFPYAPVDAYRFGVAERSLADGTKQRYRVLGSDISGAPDNSSLLDGLFDWWDFEETVASDRVGALGKLWQGTGGTVPTEIGLLAPRASPGVFFYRYFTGSGFAQAYLTCPTTLTPVGGMAFSCWFYQYTDSDETFRRLLLAAAPGNSYVFAGSRQNSNGYGYVSKPGTSVLVDHACTANAWHHLVVSHDGAALNVYIDNVKYSSAAAITPVGPMSLQLGENNQDNNFGGYVDQCALWARPVTDAEALALWNGGTRQFYGDLSSGFPGDDISLAIVGAVTPGPSSYPETGWSLRPGCDRSYEQCQALGNDLNFGGFPHFPKTSPALLPITQETPSGGKK